MSEEPSRIIDSRVWFHVVLTAYGAWLDGDDRGFRTRHHREHVDGDYKNPPPEGKVAWRKGRSERQLKQPAVVIPPAMRQSIGEAIRDRINELGGEVLCIAVVGQHVHFITKCPPGSQREWPGLAKKHAWYAARQLGWRSKLWGKRSKATPIRDRQHQENAYYYILRHREQGAWVWSALWKDGLPPHAEQAHGL